jgi:hypothetical protein
MAAVDRPTPDLHKTCTGTGDGPQGEGHEALEAISFQ